jgi:Undecaprenyl-phosphate glucose phosphotransferase
VAQDAIDLRAREPRSHYLARILPYPDVVLFVAGADLALIVTASLIGGSAYHVMVLGAVGDLKQYFGEGVNAGLLFVLLMNSLGLYRVSVLLSPAAQFRAVAGAWLIAMLTLVAFLFLLKSSADYSRGALVTFALVGMAAILPWRIILATRLRDALASGQVAGRPVILIGDAAELARYSARKLLQEYGAREIARFALASAEGDSCTLCFRDLDVIERAVKAAQLHGAAKVLLSISWSDESRRKLICERLKVLPVSILLLPDCSMQSLFAHPLTQLATSAVVELQRAPLSHSEFAIKRGLDLVLAFLGIVLLLPLLVATSIAIKLESAGPIIFKQRRKGFNGRSFIIYKFRTMTVLEDGADLRQVERDDRRVTRVGRILRKTSIDELPQLANVLRGEMSLVGPRPHAMAHDDQYSLCIFHYAFRHHVRPGLTGWAQINGFRGETSRVELMKKRVEHDLWYIDNWSIWLDLWIIVRTFAAIMAHENAY